MVNKAKIFVVHHKSENVIYSEIFQPILVGNPKENVPEGFLRDDIGENIADKNNQYNELTAIYWVYKHLSEFKGTEYIGFCHYRRFFCFDGLNKNAYVKKSFDAELANADERKIETFFKDFDFVAPRPNHYRSVARHYSKAHNKEDLPILLECIKKVAPEYLENAKEYLEGSEEYSYNMFIFKTEDFKRYCDFVFPVLNEFLSKKSDVDRLYVSERLTGIFITFLKNSLEKPLILPILHIRSKSLKLANRQVKENFKKNKDKGFFYKIKPIILCLLPRWVEQALRRRKAR